MLKLGGNIDCWCGKCKMVLAHTIEAMVGDKPTRVHCNTCRAQHGYKPHQPGEASGQGRKREAASGARPQSARGSGNRYHSLLKGKDMSSAKRYSIKESYALGDLLQHPSFGFGVATAIKDVTKIEVLFESGPKVLVHGR
jgi:hypothetical protein